MMMDFFDWIDTSIVVIRFFTFILFFVLGWMCHKYWSGR